MEIKVTEGGFPWGICEARLEGKKDEKETAVGSQII